jgi:hypothetical protein
MSVLLMIVGKLEFHEECFSLRLIHREVNNSTHISMQRNCISLLQLLGIQGKYGGRFRDDITSGGTVPRTLA